jgi:hypothetical protein
MIEVLLQGVSMDCHITFWFQTSAYPESDSISNTDWNRKAQLYFKKNTFYSKTIGSLEVNQESADVAFRLIKKTKAAGDCGSHL